MCCSPRREHEACAYVFGVERREVLQDRLNTFASRKHLQHVRHANTRLSNARPTAAHAGALGDTLQEDFIGLGHNEYYATASTHPTHSTPPMYARSTAGTRTRPSACWCISRIGMSSRGLAATVLFSE